MTKDEQFQIFWQSYPNKKGKGDARKAFEKAIKKTTLDSMLRAITEYVAKKPDWQAYKHPGPWLRGEHWDDEWEPAQSRVVRTAANYGRTEPVTIPEPLSPEERQRRADMAARARQLISGSVR